MSLSTSAVRAARIGLLALVASLCAPVTGCGTSDGVSSFLPPGPSTTAPAGDKVLYVAMTIGNRIDAYRLGSDGLLPAKPFDTISVENPRRMTIHRGVLYASLFDRVVSIALGEDGSLPSKPTSSTNPIDNYAPVDIAVRNNTLYVAVSGLGQVESYPLDLLDGDISLLPNGVGRGEFPSDYASLALNNGFLYSAARSTSYIDVFLLTDEGRVPTLAEPQDPQDAIALPDALEIRNGVLYVTSASDRSVRAYILTDNAFVPADYDSRTSSTEYYEDILLEGNKLYCAAYNAGRVDVFQVDADGMLPEEKPVFKTHGDPGSYPGNLLIDGGVMYVAQGGLNRVDAYVLSGAGIPSDFPTSSTSQTRDDSYPIHLALYQLD